MSRNNVIYRPPESDSEEDYDGFAFGDDVSMKVGIHKEEDLKLLLQMRFIPL